MKPMLGRGLTWLTLSALMLAGCTFPAPGTPVAASSGLRVWLDQPPDGGRLPLGTFTLRAHARDAGGSGVETITFLVSSGGPPVTVGSVTTDPSLPLAMAEFDWNASTPGEYAIQAQAFDREGYVFSAAAHVCVGAYTAKGLCAGAGTPAAGFKLHGLVRFRREDLDQWLESCRSPSAVKAAQPVQRRPVDLSRVIARAKRGAYNSRHGETRQRSSPIGKEAADGAV